MRTKAFRVASRSLFVAMFSIALWAASQHAQALEVVPYTPQALERLRSSGAPYALHFHSTWCATCKEQTRLFGEFAKDPAMDLTILKVDFDEDRKTVRAYRVPVSGVVVVMHGAQERARAIAETDPDALKAALKKAF